MKLSIINGSPRGRKSNSKVITDWFLESLEQKNEINEFFLAKNNDLQHAVEQIESGSTLLILFPLYTDAMPSITKEFFENLESSLEGKKDIKVYFVVQSGFPGANHCRFIERYLIYLSSLLGLEYMGTAIRPNGEGLRSMPGWFTRKPRKLFILLGKDLQEGRSFDDTVLKKLANFEKPGFLMKFLMKHTNISDGMMNGMLKKNGVFETRNNRPYI